MKTIVKNILIVFLVLLIVSGIFTLYSSPFDSYENIPLNQVVEHINNDEVAKITVIEDKLELELKDETKKISQKEKGVGLTESLSNYDVDTEKFKQIILEIKQDSGLGFWLMTLLPFLLPFLIIAFFLWFMFKQAQKGQTQAMSFGKSKAKMDQPNNKKKVTFKDVAGIEEAKEELKEIVDFLKHPKKFIDIGAKIPSGVLLMGPPGCGKTLLAKAVAGESNVPFFHISGSEFVEMFVGVGASVSKDTPVLIKENEKIRLISIGEFVDKYYKKNQENIVIPLRNIKTLGFEKEKTNFRGVKENSKKQFFKQSDWKDVYGVYRHKVDKIYEIHYNGGIIKTSGDHSIFVRDRNFIRTKRADELKPKDILVNLPFKVRGEFKPGIETTHKVKSHNFTKQEIPELTIWDNFEILEQYNFAITNKDRIPQYAIAEKIGVSQATVGFWQRNVHIPRLLSEKSIPSIKNLPQKIKTTPELMRILGYYTAEGHRTKYATQFTFGAKEKRLHKDCINLMKKIFNLIPSLEYTNDNTLKIKYFSKFLGDFFEQNCGNRSKNKHIPESLWELPKKYFLEYLKGYSDGDGYTTTDGKLSMTSVSHQLIKELTWLCSMHGIQVGIKEGYSTEGRIIKNKPIPSSKYWTLIIGKTSHPFKKQANYPYQFKKPIIKKIVIKPYNDYVYDLCGCDNEAFFGGEKPTLLHNSRVRDLFKNAKKHSPAIVFIDEIDAVGRHRGAGLGGGHDEREQTLNQILVEMDGFDTNTNVIVIAATNRPDILDPALLRPGRFDRRVVIDMPDIKERQEILKIHARNKKLSKDVKLKELAKRTPGFSGADLANLINEGAILAARKNQKIIHHKDLLESIEKVLLGPERKSHILSKDEKIIAAYHEAGHALVSASLKHTDPVHKVSIISRGRAAGYTLQLPDKDKYLKTKSEFIDELAVLLGGYSAEKITFNEITTGASNDLKVSSELARKLVTKYGMSDLGPITFGEKDEMIFLGKEIHEGRNYSEKVAGDIDEQVEKLIKNAQKEAERIVKSKKKKLKEIADVLIKKEVIERKEFESLMKN